ncbi:MAG: hypothetical protein RLN60_04445 [Phycisphaerales bacterium]
MDGHDASHERAVGATQVVERAGRPGDLLDLDASAVGEQLPGFALERAEPLGQVVHQLVVLTEAAGGLFGDPLQPVEREEDVRRFVAFLLELHEPRQRLLGDGHGSFAVRLRGPREDGELASVRHRERARSLCGDADGAPLEVDVLPEQVEQLTLAEPARNGELDERPHPSIRRDIEHGADLFGGEDALRPRLGLWHADLGERILVQESVLDSPVEHRLERAERLGERRRRAASLLDDVLLELTDGRLVDLRERRVLSERFGCMLARVPHALERVRLQVERDGVDVVLDECGECDLARLVAWDVPRVDLGFLLASSSLGRVTGHLPNGTDGLGVPLPIRAVPAEGPVLRATGLVLARAFLELDVDHGGLFRLLGSVSRIHVGVLRKLVPLGLLNDEALQFDPGVAVAPSDTARADPPALDEILKRLQCVSHVSSSFVESEIDDRLLRRHQ